MKKSIGVITGTRAEYGLLCPLIKAMKDEPELDMKLIVTGMHLSAAHGNTVGQIIRDGFEIFARVDMDIQGDSEHEICTSMGNGLRGFSELFSRIQLDLIVVLGDRYELWPACMAAVIHKIPIAHIHGGEATLGLIDDPIRHSVTKMASIHFPSIDQYGRRIIQMGESPGRVFVVGAPGIDNIMKIPLMGIEELSAFVDVDFNRKVALMTYHPVTLDSYDDAAAQVEEVLEALLQTELITLITMPNADTGGNSIYNAILRYTGAYPDKFHLRKNMGQRGYLSAMKYCSLMIGNTSSGIIESASFKVPVVNIGDRQGGRFKPGNIIDCTCDKKDIMKAVSRALSKEFAHSIAGLANPYGDGNAAGRIVRILKEIDLSDKAKWIKKGFYDLNLEGLKQLNAKRVVE